MWTWDSTKIDFSQTCWTFDGSDNCNILGGGQGVLNDKLILLRNQDDKDMLDILTMLASCRILK